MKGMNSMRLTGLALGFLVGYALNEAWKKFNLPGVDPPTKPLFRISTTPKEVWFGVDDAIVTFIGVVVAVAGKVAGKQYADLIFGLGIGMIIGSFSTKLVEVYGT